MSFNIGLSGMRAASKDLNVTGNNIANAGTVGFKQSRAEFSDVYAASVLGTGKNPQGSGVLLSNVSQQFNQGNINYTQNALDLAINGNGFFQVSNNGALSYTRAGYFGTDRDGFIVDNFGYKLQGYPVDGSGNLQNGVIGDMRVQTTNQAPKATSAINTTFNLNSALSTPTTWQATYDSYPADQCRRSGCTDRGGTDSCSGGCRCHVRPHRPDYLQQLDFAQHLRFSGQRSRTDAVFRQDRRQYLGYEGAGRRSQPGRSGARAASAVRDGLNLRFHRQADRCR